MIYSTLPFVLCTFGAFLCMLCVCVCVCVDEGLFHVSNPRVLVSERAVGQWTICSEMNYK